MRTASTVSRAGRTRPTGSLMVGTGEVAAMTGLHEDTIRSAVRRGEFPAPVRVGQKYLWHRPTIEAFLSGASLATAARVAHAEQAQKTADPALQTASRGPGAQVLTATVR